MGSNRRRCIPKEQCCSSKGNIHAECLCSAWEAKLSTSSREGKTIITKVAEAGDVLGLNATISNVPYEVTAEMMEPGQANFIPRESLILMMRSSRKLRYTSPSN